MRVIKVNDIELPENIHKCAVCCCEPDNITCSRFEFQNGFDDCQVNGHHYKEIK